MTRNAFFEAILDSIDQQIAVIDEGGSMHYVNATWIAFGKVNGVSQIDWLQSNYLDVCDKASARGDATAASISAGIRAVINGETSRFNFEYPCHSPTEKRWFMMEVTSLKGVTPRLFAITHQNITQRKNAEAAVEQLSLSDQLTGLSNRRHYDQFLHAEWHRNMRDKTPISLIVFDVDHFKKFNDQYGHIAGDQCLSEVASIIRGFCRRSTDLAARWGGEEFVLLLGNTPGEHAVALAEAVRLAVQQHQIGAFGRCTISAGVASMVPADGRCEALLQQADEALYRAKSNGRNMVVTGNPVISQGASD